MSAPDDGNMTRSFSITVLVIGAVLATATCRDPTGPGAGRTLWSVAGSSLAAPAVADSTVYFASRTHALVALDTRTGAQRWQAVAGSGVQPPGENVLVIGTHVIMADNALFGFDRTTGARE